MAAAPPRSRDLPPALPDELVEEILLRVPPNDPACLLRASLVCKTWGRAGSHPAFRRRLHELHRAPPVLGFLHGWDDERIPHFIPTTASSFSLAAPDCHSWRALDCRHGRALFLSKGEDTRTRELLLWEPITGAQQRVPVPAAFESDYPTAAVFCAADGCDHRDCLGGPFRVVFVYAVIFEEDTDDEEYVTSACIYSSETGAWGELTSMHGDFSMEFTEYSSVLVGRSLLYFMSDGYGDSASILEYDLARHGLTVFSPPDNYYDHRYSLMLAEDGGLGVIQDLGPHLKLWTREATDGTDARWVLSRVIYLGNLFPTGALLDAGYSVQVLGFAEGANVIFVNTVAGLFTIELQSELVRKVCNGHGCCNLIPVVSFYTPVPRGEHQNLPVSKPSEDAGRDEGEGEEEETVDQAQQLFDEGSNAIKEGYFVNAFECVTHDLKIRIPRYGEVALEDASTLNMYGCTLLPKAQEVIDPSSDVPKSAPK